MIVEDKIEGFGRLGLVPVVSVRIVPAAAAISIVAPPRVPTVSAPFIMGFILLVPLASYHVTLAERLDQ
jgi:hypothetical protein